MPQQRSWSEKLLELNDDEIVGLKITKMGIGAVRDIILKLLVAFATTAGITLSACASNDLNDMLNGNGNDSLAENKTAASQVKSDGIHQQKDPMNEVDISPHWDKTQCKTCHFTDNQDNALELRAKDERELCLKCHENDIVHKYIHPDKVKVTKNIKKQLKSSWKKEVRLDKDGMLTCMTCHDLTIQCLNFTSYTRKLNRNFLREGPYSSRHDICYRCHDKEKYKRLNSHEQIAANGTVMVNKCMLCHEISPNTKVRRGMKREAEKFPIIKPLGNDRLLLCTRCHKKIDHPSGAFTVKSINEYRHFVKITDEKMRALEKTTRETGSALPLEPDTGRIYCATCHEPHQPGLFAGDDPKLFTKTQKRLRTKDICTRCHDK